MKNILIVEDEPIASFDIGRVLIDHDFKIVDRVHTGEAAIEAYEKYKPGVIIMDVHLKGKMTGIDAAKEIVQSASPYFIFLSGDYDEYLKGTGIRYDYLKKPFTEEQLLDHLNLVAKGTI